MAAIASFETTPVSSIFTTIVSFAEAFLIVSTSLDQSTFAAGVVAESLSSFSSGVGSFLPGSSVFFTSARMIVPPSFAAGMLTVTVLSEETVYVLPS